MRVYPYISVNLDITERETLGFPFLDYGFLYGYGLFESIRVFKGQPLLLDEHLARLQRGSIILDIPFDFTNSEVVSSIQQLIKKNDIEDAILNIYLTPGDRSQDPAKVEIELPFLLMVCRPWPDYDSEKRHVLECRQESFQRTPLDRFKTLSWMKNVLEKRLSSHVDDVLLYSQNEMILETTRANVFFVKGDVIVTPKSPSILTGITRQYLIDRQDELGIDVLVDPIFVDYLETYDEIFLTNALKGVILVEGVEGYPNLRSGPVSEKVRAVYRKSLGIT